MSAPPAARLDLGRHRHVHVLNAGGAGMSGIAAVLAEQGHRVSGAEPRATPFLGRLRELGAAVAVGEPGPLPDGVDAVVVSTATPPDHPQLAAARQRGVPVVHRTGALAALCALRRTVAVAGTHGKTTTAAMVTAALGAAGLEPGHLVGGDAVLAGGHRLGGAAWGGGDLFVVEADESDGTLLALPAAAALVTSVEPDHLDHWGGASELREGFARFLAGAPGPRLACADDPVAAELADEIPGTVTYGRAPGAAWRLAEREVVDGGSRVLLVHGGAEVVRVDVGLAGMHNATNAAGAVALAVELGVAPRDAAAGVARVVGVGRRFERRGRAGEVTFVDDYAHLPGEVRPALAAAREGGWSRVVCVFQPHRYTRTAALWREFADAFVGADVLVVTELYPAGEEPIAGVSGRLVADAVRGGHTEVPVVWLPERDEVVRWLAGELRPGDLCLTLGAGDLTRVPDEVMALLDARGARGDRRTDHGAGGP